MKKLFILPILAVGMVFGVYLLADDERYENENFYNKYSQSRVTPVQTKEGNLYIKECGSCHMAYQKEFLPKRSWNKMMNTLDNHFGVDATLEPEDKKILTEYLTATSNRYVDRHIRKMAASIGRNDVPLRITDTPYFKKEHRKIPKKLIEQKEVKSMANCNACHGQAQNGNYGERSISIPNYGRWDD